MKQLLSCVILLFGLLSASSAAAWMYWYYTPLPYTPVATWYMHFPGLFAYNSIPHGGAVQYWQFNSMQQPAGVQVEQTSRPDGYSYTIHIANHRREDVHIAVQGSALLVRGIGRQSAFTPYGTHRFGSFAQWLLLPADANSSGMRWSVHDGVLEIFIPRLR